MKNFFYILSFLLLLNACQTTKKDSKPDYEILSGNIRNSPVNKFTLKDVFNKKTAEIQLDEQGNFSDTLHLPEAYYKMNLGNQYTWMYLKPGDSLKINIDYNDFDQSLTYQGKGSNINNYLAAKMLKGIELRSKTSYKYVGNLKEKDFLRFTDSVFSIYNRMLSGVKEEKEFVKLEKFKNKVHKNSFLAQYPILRRYMLNDPNFKVSKNYPKVFEGIDPSDSTFTIIPQGNQYLSDNIDYLITKGENTEEVEPFLRLKAIDSLVNNPEMKEYLAKKQAKYYISYTKNLEGFYQLITKIIKNPETLQNIKEKYNNLKAISPGTASPDFTAYDINGKEYHLKDFAGKTLYIDLWATWCSPCRAEIPYLEKLKEKYKGKAINFLSLDVYDDKAKWEKMIKDNKMGGWQLINTDRDMPFLKKYVVDGIPRFIFLDKEGKIIDANAPRPSEKKLIELLDRYID